MPATLDSEIQVTVYGAAQGVDTQSFGRVVVVTEDVLAGFTDDYRIYEKIGDVTDDSDLGTTVAERLAAFFSQNKHPRDIAVVKKAADVAKVMTHTIAVSTGKTGDKFDIDVTYKGTVYTGTYTSLADSETAATIHTALKADLTTKIAAIDITVGGASPDITLTADTAGDAFTSVSTVTQQSGSDATITDVETAANVSVKTTLDDLLDAWDEFWALALTTRDDTQSERLAEWTLANKRLCAIQSSTAAIKAGTAGNLFETLKAAANDRVIQIWHDDDDDAADIALLAHGLSANPDAESGVWYDRTLQGVTPATITSTEKTAIHANNGCIYLTLKKVGAMSLGKVADGSWTDDVVMEAWTATRVNEAIAAFRLREHNANRRIPYTKAGVDTIEKIGPRAIYERGMAIGHNKARSYSAVVPDPDTLDETTLESRALTMSASWLKAGGIKEVTVTVGITAA